MAASLWPAKQTTALAPRLERRRSDSRAGNDTSLPEAKSRRRDDGSGQTARWAVALRPRVPRLVGLILTQTPSGGGHASTPDRSKTRRKDVASGRGIDKQRPVTEALLIHPKQPARAGLGAILRERHGPSIASRDDDTAAAV